MPGSRRLNVPAAVATSSLAAVTACTSQAPAPSSSPRSLAAIHELVRENNEHADPYEMGTGDSLGAHVYDRYEDEVLDPD